MSILEKSMKEIGEKKAFSFMEKFERAKKRTGEGI